MRLVLTALLLPVVAAAPLFMVGTLDPTANPVGLGLLFMAAAAAAPFLLAFALLRLLWRYLARR
ncbi:MAG TPA: hypothetical protein VFN28_00275 [Amaricoccus sp.]|nr:hypothetical protein [Amaricoccus sp.]